MHWLRVAPISQPYPTQKRLGEFAYGPPPPPWIVEPIPGSFKVRDAMGQALAYLYARENKPLPRPQEYYYEARPALRESGPASFKETCGEWCVDSDVK